VQSLGHVKTLKTQAGRFLETGRIDIKQHAAICKYADSLLNQLSDWQEAGAAPPAAVKIFPGTATTTAT
ncbi:MAG: hypothetical protein LBR26_04590, partial [Prevotella sp.]|nr:hypothetical protein [Prevotella sp.]